jgi:hypothetical protein
VNDNRTPTCGRQAGDDSDNPMGTDCNAEDLCAPGWHICPDIHDLRGANPDAAGVCNGAVPSGAGSLWFATRQSHNGCGRCADGTQVGGSCNSVDCTAGCLNSERTSSDIFGCGNYGSSNSCSGSTMMFSNNLCSSIASQGWSGNLPTNVDDIGYCEIFTLVHTHPSTGGVVCCRNDTTRGADGDGVVNDEDNCTLDDNPDQADFDGDGHGDVCDLDEDGDGVLEGADVCPGTPAGEVVLPNGCSVAQECLCDFPWRNHGGCVGAVAHAAEQLLELGRITEAEKDSIVSEATRSDCGSKSKESNWPPLGVRRLPRLRWRPTRGRAHDSSREAPARSAAGRVHRGRATGAGASGDGGGGSSPSQASPRVGPVVLPSRFGRGGRRPASPRTMGRGDVPWVPNRSRDVR